MKNDIKIEIGMRIRQIRKKKGLTIEETAHLAGVHPNYLGEAERGKKNFSIITIEKIAKALEAPVSKIFSGKTINYTVKHKQDNRLSSLMRNASPEERAFLIKTAKFVIRRKK
ncbi:MAG: helix-turn-helix transcriptional regulator [Elusimicrobia bacterium]|nr:helix-turn-helix transcriptional regulator [Elusimicrobiota bacterium]